MTDCLDRIDLETVLPLQWKQVSPIMFGAWKRWLHCYPNAMQSERSPVCLFLAASILVLDALAWYILFIPHPGGAVAIGTEKDPVTFLVLLFACMFVYCAGGALALGSIVRGERFRKCADALLVIYCSLPIVPSFFRQ